MPASPAPQRPLPAPIASRLRARSVVELVDEGYAALRAHPALLLGTAALFLVPVTAVVALIGQGDPTPGLVTDGSWWAGVVSMLGFSLATALVGVPLARAVALQAAGVPITWRAVYAAGAKPWLVVIGAWAALAPLRFVSALVFFVPYVAITAVMIPLSAVIALEGGGVGTSLRRAWRLGWRGFGRALGVLSLQQLTGWFVVFVLATVPAILVTAAPDAWQRPLANLGQLAVGLLVTPPAAWTAAAFYLDERVRREGFDLWRAVDAWEETGPPGEGRRPVPYPPVPAAYPSVPAPYPSVSPPAASAGHGR
ncbi:MAG: hypothetical protein R2755_34180 [Acidimicrobiales bacterium]